MLGELTFGQSVRVRREETGRSLRSVAQEAGISAAYLSDIELSRRQPPPAAMVRKLAKALGVDTDSLQRIAWRERNDSEYVAQLAAENERLRLALDGIAHDVRARGCEACAEKESMARVALGGAA
jgi:transcriptional regulator with XRE-family HTH domain